MRNEINGPTGGRATSLLSDEAMQFIGDLHDRFEATRRQILAARQVRQREFDSGLAPDFLPGESQARDGDWRVADAPLDLRNRRVEITGPTDAKMIINALNSGAGVFMADFEDANTPTWSNMIEGQLNLFDTVRRSISHEEAGKTYELDKDLATLFVRPRGWHLDESHVLIGGRPVSGSLFDAGIYLFHNAKELLDRGSGPYFYLPKLESHEEARLWNDVFVFAEDQLAIPLGSIRATVLIETITAGFEMEEILFELRQHSVGLNAGRWDYIFSLIKKMRANPAYVLPDRTKVTMQTPFMRAYAEALVQVCHRRGAHAIGGMSAFIPSRSDPAINAKAFPAIIADKRREADQGFDGAWVAHPDLVPVVGKVFENVLGDRDNQITHLREDVSVSASDLLDVASAGSEVTEDGLRSNIAVGILYLNSWMQGRGAAALFNLMEDTATAEISRSQVWQWLHHGAKLTNGASVDSALVDRLVGEEMGHVTQLVGERSNSGRLGDAHELFQEIALREDFHDFLTLPGRKYLGN